MASVRKRPPAATDEPDPGPDDLANFGQSLGPGEYRMKLHRFSDQYPREWQYVGELPLTSDPLEAIRADYGGGRYRVAVVDGSGKYMKGLHRTIAIRGEGRARTTAAATPRAEDSVQRAVALVAGITGALAPLGVAAMKLLERREPTGTGITMAEALMMMQNAERKGMEQGVELGHLRARRTAPGPTEERREDPTASAIERYVPRLLDLITGPARLPAAADPAASPPPPPPPPMPLPTGYEWLAELRPLYPLLAREATIGTPPAALVAMAVGRIPEPTLDAIEAASKLDHFEATVLTDLAPHGIAGPWAVQLVHAIRDGVCTDTDNPE